MTTHLLDPEQPTTCPNCGARTTFDDLKNQNPPSQIHKCLNEHCGYEFIGEFDLPEDKKA